MKLIHWVDGLSLRDRLKSLYTWERLRVELLLLHIEGSQLRLSRCLLDVSLGSCFGHAHLGGVPGLDRVLTGEIIYLDWHENVFESPWRSWWKWPGRGASGSPCSGCSPANRMQRIGRKRNEMKLVLKMKQKTNITNESLLNYDAPFGTLH